MNTSRVTISSGARELLNKMAAAEGVSSREYMESLLHYAGSKYYRPGSWEAASEFSFDNYNDKAENGGFADRWF